MSFYSDWVLEMKFSAVNYSSRYAKCRMGLCSCHTSDSSDRFPQGRRPIGSEVMLCHRECRHEWGSGNRLGVDGSCAPNLSQKFFRKGCFSHPLWSCDVRGASSEDFRSTKEVSVYKAGAQGSQWAEGLVVSNIYTRRTLP